jgi:hypothetical protein
VLTLTGVNEFGTLVSVHDYYSHNADFSPGRMPRTVAFRYAMTFAINPDVSTHLTDTFAELQNYEIMTGGFLNYYAPEGHGGVMTCNPYASGPDFYDLRLPQESWHHGEAMITTNAWTDGTYTPNDEDFGADAYYDDETPKTLENHWNLLVSFSGHRGVHMLSVAYRDREDMTVWAIGKLSSFEQTPRLEWEWNDLFNINQPPGAPTITGETEGNVNAEYDYTFNAVDPDGDMVKYYIDWGDTTSDVTDLSASGVDVIVPHTFTTEGTFIITAYTEDEFGLIGPSNTFEVTMKKSKALSTTLIQIILERYPILSWLFQRLELQ